MSEDLSEIEALSSMGERRTKLQERLNRALEPISSFVCACGGAEISSSMGYGILVFNATRSDWRRMLRVEDSPLVGTTVSLFPNMAVELDQAAVSARSDDPKNED